MDYSSFDKDLMNLFTLYTGPLGAKQGTSTSQGPLPYPIGQLVAIQSATKAGPHVPFLLIVGNNIIYFPTNDMESQVPNQQVKPIQTPGFATGTLELAGISHIGPLLASLVQMKADQYSDSDMLTALTYLNKLLVAIQKEKSSPEYWGKMNNIFAPKQTKIADMITTALEQTAEYVHTAMKDLQQLNFTTLREFLNPSKGGNGFNSVMIATFSLANLANHYQVLTFFRDSVKCDLSRLQVLVTGQGGRATSGLTVETNPSCQRIEAWAQKNGTTVLPNMYVAPNIAALATIPTDNAAWLQYETKARTVWLQTNVAVKLSTQMFEGIKLPANKPLPSSAKSGINPPPPLSEFYSRLKYAMGNPTQQLASCTSEYILESLIYHDLKFDNVQIPGLDYV